MDELCGAFREFFEAKISHDIESAMCIRINVKALELSLV